MSSRTRGAVAWVAATAALVALAAGCSGGGVEIEGPEPSGADAEACAALVDALPEELAGQPRRETSGDGVGAAWGDPAVVLTCGVDEPEDFDRFSRCLEVDGVGWFLPPEAEGDLAADAVLTAVGFAPRVSVLIPSELRGGTAAAILTGLAGPVRDSLELVDACA